MVYKVQRFMGSKAQGLKPVVWGSSTRNVEPLAQTWIRCECLYSNGHNGLTSPKRIQSSRARAGLNRSTYVKYIVKFAYGYLKYFAEATPSPAHKALLYEAMRIF
jgi:hypothetical protein